MAPSSIVVAAAVACAAATMSAAPTSASGPAERLRDMVVQSPLTNDTYYSGIDFSLTGDAMKLQLQKLTSQHKEISYDDVWTAFEQIDIGYDGCSEGQVVDIYAGVCYPASSQCGNYKTEGDCFNREHTWPKSWWGGFSAGKGAQTDLFHLRPADGWINALRSNYPYGDVDEPTYTGPTGCKFGPCASSTGAPADTKCFEPAPEWRGDLARGYFYLSTTYGGEWSCCSEAGTDKSSITAWEESVLRNWHESDPVSSGEVARNEAIYQNFQHNRNPFIDHPELVGKISDF